MHRAIDLNGNFQLLLQPTEVEGQAVVISNQNLFIIAPTKIWSRKFRFLLCKIPARKNRTVSQVPAVGFLLSDQYLWGGHILPPLCFGEPWQLLACFDPFSRHHLVGPFWKLVWDMIPVIENHKAKIPKAIGWSPLLVYHSLLRSFPSWEDDKLVDDKPTWLSGPNQLCIQLFQLRPPVGICSLFAPIICPIFIEAIKFGNLYIIYTYI